MWFYIQIAAYVSVVVGYGLLLLLAVRYRIRRGRAQRVLEATLLFTGLWTLVLGLLALLAPGVWWAFVRQRVTQVGLVILALLTAEFADAFVQRRGRRWPRLGFVGLVTVAAVALDALPASVVLPSFVPMEPARLANLLLLFSWLLSTAAAWWIGARALRRVTGSKHRNRLHYLLAALLGFIVGDLLVLLGGIPDMHVGLATRLLGLCVITFTGLRYDLPDLRRLSLATLRVVLLSVLTALAYFGALLIVSYVSGAWPDLSQLVTTAPVLILALLLIAMVDVIWRPRLRRLFDRTVLGETLDVQKALRTHSQQINLILDSERLADTTLDWLRTTLGLQHSAFILFTSQDNDRVELSVLRATTRPLPVPQVFRQDSRFITHFCNIRRPLSQYDLDMLSWFQDLSADERLWLKDLILDLYVPILVADRPVALLGLGPKAGGQPYSDQDLETLMILAGQTGTALENARLMDDLRAVQGDLHRLSGELAETNQQLQRLDQTKADFITIASHELRTPLTQIYGYSDILSKLEADELGDARVVYEFVQGITQGASRLKSVVDAMVDMSLIETGSLRVDPVTLPVGVVVQNAVETMQGGTDRRRVKIRVRDLSKLPYIQADSTRLEQVFLSLLSNAVKFTPDGGEITVSGSLDTSSKTAYVDLMVSDSGIGINPEEQALIFEKFHRSEDLLRHSTDDVGFKGAGPGLGLAIAKGIVEAHEGRIWVESPGRDEENCPGSTFHVRLPVAGPTGGAHPTHS